MSTLPKIHFSDLTVAATEPTIDRWELHFSSYLLQGQQPFFAEIARLERRVEDLASDMGLGADTVRILGGLAPKVSLWRRWVALQKVPEIVKLVAGELKERRYERIVIVGQHQASVSEIREGLRDWGAVMLYENTPVEKRQAFMRRFMGQGPTTRKPCHVLVAQVQALRGDDLTITNEMLFAEPSWLPDDNVQAVFRMHKRGQTRPVNVRFVGLDRSIDAKVTRLMKQKTRNAVCDFE
jgi:hypothetical protein